MPEGSAELDGRMADLRRAVARHWGFSTLRPMQEAAARAVLAGRDSLVVLPTGGGKSLCFQAPAAVRESEVTVVVSPLIALMQDQVDNLTAVGVPARCLNSMMPPEGQQAVRDELFAGGVRLLYVSPERLALAGFRDMLAKLNVRTFAVDEAHCISQWGHEFRPDYRQLGRLRESFPDASVHAYTATATVRVREDIAGQLGLRDPEVLVGDFDRPNLIYRVVPRSDLARQAREVVAKHRGEAGIIYCLSRKAVDELTAKLREAGVNAVSYHAGMEPADRRQAQEAFRREECDVVVATVAFGMGIDRPNVRYVLHAGLPKSVEHYQQEAGRAGRDGLEAECVLLFSPADYRTWQSIIAKKAAEPDADPGYAARALGQLAEMTAYGRSPVCRHRMLVEHFGQRFGPANCQACDLCLGEVQMEPESLTIAQKILSCVARLKQGFGVGHLVSVLRGEKGERVLARGHDRLSTHGLLSGHKPEEIREWVYQLIDQGLLAQEPGEYPVLKLNGASWEVMRGERDARLLRTVKRSKGREARSQAENWAGVDRDLFERLRQLRLELARERQVPAYVIFSDSTLREMAKTCPRTLAEMGRVGGVGETKLRDFGEAFLAAIREHTAGV